LAFDLILEQPSFLDMLKGSRWLGNVCFKIYAPRIIHFNVAIGIVSVIDNMLDEV
jgi:hypothetical protein